MKETTTLAGYNARMKIINAVSSAQTLEDIAKIHTLVGDLAVSFSVESRDMIRRAQFGKERGDFERSISKAWGLEAATEDFGYWPTPDYPDRKSASAGR